MLLMNVNLLYTTVVFLVVVPFFSSCQQISEQIKDYRYFIDSIELKGINKDIREYSWRYSLGRGSAIGYVHSDNTLFQHELTHFENKKQFSFPENYTGYPFYSIVQINQNDYYYLHPDGELYMLKENESPVLIKNIKENDFIQRKGLMIDNLLSMDTKFHFLSDTKILLPVTWHLYEKKGKYSNYKKSCPSFIIYDLQSDSFSICNIWTEGRTKDNDYMDRFRNYSELVGNKLYVSTPYSPVISVFNVDSDIVEREIFSKSLHQSDTIKPIKKEYKKDGEEQIRYLIEEAYYGPIIYNEFRQEFYRIFYHPLPRKNKNVEFTIYTDKASSILVYDMSFKLKFEVLFEKDYFIFMGLTPTREGVVLNSFITVHDDRHFIKRLNFDK